MDPGTLAAILTIGTIVVGATTGVVGHLLGRRATSGRVATSEAAVLWEQAQRMRGELEAQRDKAMEQRDRLIESQSAQVLPTLQLVVDSLREIGESLARLEGRVRG
jgi:hypothetical protein